MSKSSDISEYEHYYTSLGYATSQDEVQIKYVIDHDLHELGDCSKR